MFVSRQLAQENARYKELVDELTAAKTTAATKNGEIAIIRSNQAKLSDNYERQLVALRKQLAEEIGRHRGEVEAARVEGKMLATENAFLKQDLAEESMRIHARKPKGRPEETPAPETPKKTRVLPFRDGFDDEEILAVSPTKPTPFKHYTTTARGKRRRQLSPDRQAGLPLDAPVAPQTAEPLAPDDPDPDPSDEEEMEMEMEMEMGDAVADGPARAVDDDAHARVVKRLLNHRTYPNEQSDLEVLGRLAFPSAPQRTLSTRLLEETATRNRGSYLMDYAEAVIALWAQALAEKYFAPVPIFLAVTREVLALDARTPGSGLIELLVPVLQDSGDVNGVPRFRHSPQSRQSSGQIRRTPASQLEPRVDATAALALLHQIACSRLHVAADLERFWRCMRYDFVLMMLNCAQPLHDLILTLSLLATSVRADAFGSLLDTEADQRANENYVIDRVANLLSETPQPDEGAAPYPAAAVCQLRLEALSLLQAIAFNATAPSSRHGSGAIAAHPTVLARAIRAMHDELDALYRFPPERALHAILVNGLMRLVYGVLRRHPDQVDLPSKLGRLAGGKQKFLVALTRLAFSEGLVLEEGIDDETVEMAHAILDDAVNPQEAEALQEAFSSSRREE
ncbi:hypothetical protein P168DRAFT_184769 [Aspergillus campestris IBT 28561]|uniref:DNA repair protein Rad26 n=1 Tax=Aspergillus campestris (strain IBT 28561) TaxID=1392248 RepID=A0A2I1CXZ2_ASPC2|nr:uncharacterized protein P168DRAFT_184769 [Aspergillus campestris IBT 28561]PKY02481.1 hypothetical protein P168DRAFT_184769 [Aspergillus campestris IBT 28561]